MNGKSKMAEERKAMCLTVKSLPFNKPDGRGYRKFGIKKKTRDWAQKLLFERRNIEKQKVRMYGKLGDGRKCGEESLLNWGGYSLVSSSVSEPVKCFCGPLIAMLSLVPLFTPTSI